MIGFVVKAPVSTDFKVSTKPLTLSIHMHIDNSIVFKDNWEVFKKAAELTNITLKGTASVSASDSTEVFNIMMASGRLSDIICTTRVNFTKFGKQGAFKPLESYMKYAPNFKAFLVANPDVKKYITAADGHIYFIPTLSEAFATSGWFIRQDWLDKLKLPVPKTLAQYHDTLKAFVNDDPNGNGKKDEIGFMSRSIGGISNLYPLWDAHTDSLNNDMYVDKKGKVKFGPMEPAYKDAMINLAQWYKDGLIDKEIFTRGSSARNVLLANNTLGATHDLFGSTSKLNYTVKNIPGLKLYVMAPPASKSGGVQEATKRSRFTGNGWGMAYSNKNPIETMKYFDFFYSNEGKTLMNFGIEGKTYTMVKGVPKFTDEFKAKSGIPELNDMGAEVGIGYDQDFTAEQQLLLTDISNTGIDMYRKNNYFATQYPLLDFTDSQERVIETKMAAIDTCTFENSQKWILGGESVQTGWDDYIKTLKKLGIDDVIKVHQNAYFKYSTKK